MVLYTKFKNTVSIVPDGPLQFLDIPLNLNVLPRKVQSEFWEYFNDDSQRYILKALLQDKETGDYLDRQIHEQATDPRNGKKIVPIYSVNVEKALEPFLDKWVPAPFLRTEPSGNDVVQPMLKGLSNWSRMRLVALPESDVDGNTHVLTIAFDPKLENPRDDGITPAITRADVIDCAEMALASEVAQYAWFVGEEWIDQWLQELFVSFLKSKNPNRKVCLDHRDYKVEYIARYITLIDVLAATEAVPRVRLINTAQGTSPVEVDLVLDVGNSRTCGMLIERNEQGGPSLGNSYVLELRDLTQPEQRYTEPFSSNVCFAKCKFGDPEDLSYGSQRETDPFEWPSLVRVGPEAERLAASSRQEEGLTSMSSPKRYLWDEQSWRQQWRFCPDPEHPDNIEEPVNTGAFALCINDRGTPIDRVEDRVLQRKPITRGQSEFPVTSPHFSRSSLMMFMLSEVLLQALVNINSPAQRASRLNPDIPRRLRRLIITVPAAMPIAERNIFKRWATYAVSTLWKALGWSDKLEELAATSNGAIDFREPPTVVVDWDEATSTQIVFLYNELAEKFTGDVTQYFNLRGKMRQGYQGEKTLRVASIDIGGGTSDLIITTYECKDHRGPIHRLEPHIDFREGFNIAGDDVLKKVIERHFIVPLGQRLREAGISHPADFLTIAVGRDVADQSESYRRKRRQFVNQVAVSFGLHILKLSEDCDLRQGDAIKTVSYAEVFREQQVPGADAVEFIDENARRAGAKGFTIRDFSFDVDLADVFATITSAISPVIMDLCEIIGCFDCDLLVLSGRPSALPAVQATVLNFAPVAPDRIYPLSQYRIGKWYPYWSSGGRIRDPKTAVSVGAMLCLLSNGHLSNFNMRTSNLKPRSTARFIGLLDQNGKIANDTLLFEGMDLEKDRDEEKSAMIDYLGPTRIGFRQLPLERWTATPFFALSYSDQTSSEDLADKLPFRVEISYTREPEDNDGGLQHELPDEGVFRVESIETSAGDMVHPSALNLQLRTMLDENGYWLDTGILNIPNIN
ncbi:virulence factor SrfB [Thalassospira sp. TSL5-1]|uniref:virulence factor SrfB n=1 Tax=Thalassospira sp. TSL5-1 TaxID=1544451 RepID=UPI00093FDD6F|nr:virulence factor SrfB [Thalassospira sp. TSL5-1]OKH86712.1 hypothetical protein LF95_20095 [Thalassospira sp. TSL5-1]